MPLPRRESSDCEQPSLAQWAGSSIPGRAGSAAWVARGLKPAGPIVRQPVGDGLPAGRGVCSLLRHRGRCGGQNGGAMRKFVALVAGSLAVGGAVDGVAVAVASPAGPVGRPIGRGGKIVPARVHPCGDRRRAACLHTGGYCSHTEAREYVRYHFVCERVRGTYRLERCEGTRLAGRVDLTRFRRHLNASGRKPGKVRSTCRERGRRIRRSSAARRCAWRSSATSLSAAGEGPGCL